MAGIYTLPMVGRDYGESLSLTTTRLYVQKFPWAKEMELYVPTEARVQICPPLDSAWFHDVSAGTYTNVKSVLSDRNAANLATLSNFEGLTDLFYIGSRRKFNKWFENVSAVNGNAATRDVEYWNGTAWTDVAGDSDGTASGGATMAQDGEYSFTLPSDWAPTALTAAGARTPLYYIRYSVSATLDSAVTLEELILGGEDANYQYVQPGIKAFNVEQAGGLVALVGTGTATGRLNQYGFSE